MRSYIIYFITTVVSALLLVGCFGDSRKSSNEGKVIYAPEYASGFEIIESGSSSILKIVNPWQEATDVVMELFLARNGERPESGFEGIVVDAPVRRIVCMSSSYTAFIESLGKLDAVVGVSGGRFISSERLRERFEKGVVKDVGYDNNINYELIASLKPDLVLVYGVAGENSVMTNKLRELSINVMYIGDYLENSPLGKAEWAVAFGEMLDCRDHAQQNFESIRDDYNNLLEKTKSVELRPSVMLNAPWRDTWFVPGDRSYIVQLIKDAGGIYACQGVDSDKSRPISAESAFVTASSADIWINPNQAKTIDEVVQMNPKFASIPAVKDGQIYNCTKRSTPDGGSDFWESGAVYPNVVLQDMIEIMHPGLLADYEPYYFIKLK